MSQIKFKGMDGVDEATITQIHVQVGQEIKKGDNVFDIEADKASESIVSEVDGKVGKINFKEGDSIKTGDVVVEFGAGDATSTSPTNMSVPTPTAPAAVQPTASTSPVQLTPGVLVLATPVARAMARDLGVHISNVHGTGPNGRILKADIIAFGSGKNVSLPASRNINNIVNKIEIPTIKINGVVHREPMSAMRKAIAKQMTLAKTVIAETTLMKNINVTKLIEIRAQLKAQAEKQGVKLTYMPFFMKACALALKDFPILNSSYDQSTEEIIFKDYYNIGMATDTSSGLMVPVIKGVDQMNVLQIGAAINDLAVRTRDRKLKPDEMKDATFTITNFGSAGIELATPVINFPEVAILGVGTIEKKPAVNSNNEIEIWSMLPLSLSIDHRLIDGADGGRFLMRVTELLESPALLLL